ncbi:MAG: hypothetical protein Q9176_005987 [Flavoplaca citrina]
MIIQCKLIDVDLFKASEYEALSYVWGKDDNPNFLHLPGGHLKVTENLASALRGLRYGGRCRLLWMDAVCIHQSDSTEKAQQVALMARIYRKAFRVLAWLGKDDGKIINIPTILKFSQMAKQLGLKSPAPENKAVIQKWFYGDPEKVIWLEAAIHELGEANFPKTYESAWFTRMWIVQEALLAKHLLLRLGPYELDWNDFERVMIFIKAADAALQFGPVVNREAFVFYAWNLILVRHRRYQTSKVTDEPTQITYYMHQLKHRRCTDNRDRVFALRGLLPASSGLNIQLDYTKSVDEVYWDLATTQVKLGNMAVLSQAGLWKRQFFQLPELMYEKTVPVPACGYLPSWVPDYGSDATFSEVFYGAYVATDDRMSADNAMSAVVSFSRPHRLTVEATVIDHVPSIHIASFIHDQAIRADHVTCFFKCRKFFIKLKETLEARFRDRSSPIDEDRTTAFAYSLVAGGTSGAYKRMYALSKPIRKQLDPLTLWQNYEEQCISETGDVYKEMQKQHGASATARNRGIDYYSRASAESTTAWYFHIHLQTMLLHHAFFISEKGYVGMAPSITNAVGDVLVFIRGAMVPFVLRPLSGDPSQYLLVGPCYIHGLMGCEVVERTWKEGDTIHIL